MMNKLWHGKKSSSALWSLACFEKEECCRAICECALLCFWIALLVLCFELLCFPSAMLLNCPASSLLLNGRLCLHLPSCHPLPPSNSLLLLTIAKYSTLFAFASVFIFLMQMKNHTENKTYFHTICTNCMNWAAASDIFEDANVPLWLLLNCLQPRRATGQKETVEMRSREFCYSKCPNECG